MPKTRRTLTQSRATTLNKELALQKKIYFFLENKTLNEQEILKETGPLFTQVLKTMIPPNRQVFLNTVMTCAARNGFVEILKYLIEEKKLATDPNSTDMEGGPTPLAYAIMKEQKDAAIYLISKTNLLLNQDVYGWTVLHQAAYHQQDEIIEAILKKEPGIINIRNHEDSTALTIAVEKNTLKCVQLLINKGADLTIKATRNPFVTSLVLHRHEILSYLLDRPEISPIEYYYANSLNSPFALLLEKDFVAYDLLFQAGAGLDLKRISKEIISTLKLIVKPTEEQEWECLIIGQEVKTKKRIYVTRFKEFLSHLDEKDDEGNRRYSFKLNQIAKSAHRLAIITAPNVNPNVEEIAEKLKEHNNYSNNSEKETDPTIMSYIEFENMLQKIRKLPEESAFSYFHFYRAQFIKETDIFIKQDLANIVNLRDQMGSSDTDSDLMYKKYLNLYVHYFNYLLRSLAYLDHPSFVKMEKLEKEGYLEPIYNAFLESFYWINTIYEIGKFEAAHLQILTPFNHCLKAMIHLNRELFEKKYVHFYNFLVNVQIRALYLTSMAHLAKKNLILVYHLIPTIIRLHERTPTLTLWPENKLIKINSLANLASIQSNEHQFDRAYENITTALSIATMEYSKDIYIPEMVSFIKDFLRKNASVISNNDTQYLLKLSKDYLNKFNETEEIKNELSEIDKMLSNLSLSTERPIAAKQLEEKPVLPIKSEPVIQPNAGQDVSVPTHKKEKIKTRGIPCDKRNTKRLEKSTRSEEPQQVPPPLWKQWDRDNYTDPIPVMEFRRSGQTDFEPYRYITMSKSDPAFNHFRKFTNQGWIRRIDSKGNGQEGAKIIFIEKQNFLGGPHVDVPAIRLKVCNSTERPLGYLLEEACDKNGNKKLLFSFNSEDIKTKKQEKISKRFR